MEYLVVHRWVVLVYPTTFQTQRLVPINQRNMTVTHSEAML
jgi:hypothetical protein